MILLLISNRAFSLLLKPWKVMPDNFDFMNINKKRWNELVDIHVSDSTYDIDKFKEGNSTLFDIERNLLGNLSGKKILHLQCHFGLDTLSLILEGAEEVVGVDYSEKAIEVAKRLAEELNMNARFVLSNILELHNNFDQFGSFDIVFTSYGTITWLSELSVWANNIFRYLKPGGKFVIVDSHPFAQIFDDEIEEPNLFVKYRYFDKKDPEHFKVDGSYASDAETTHQDEFLWTHPISEIINSLTEAGLSIDSFNEYAKINWPMFPFLIKKKDGWYYFPNNYNGPLIPLCFSIKATKSENIV